MRNVKWAALSCASAAVLAYAAPALAADAEVGEIVVTGQAASERRAVEAKREADQIQDAIYADDVGKLPDQNVAEAVRRLPGVSVANDQGEGRYVIIRGVNPALANVTLNNQTAPAPEPESRQVKLDDIPSSLIGSVTVIKSLTPDLDANAIAGQVNIQTLSAFDKPKPFARVRGEYGRFELNHKNPYNIDATAGGRFGPDEQFGAVLSGNYSKRPIRSENLQGSSNWVVLNGNPTPDDFRLRYYNLERERTGMTAALDWRPDDKTQVYVRALYDKFTDHETRDQFRIEIPVGTAGAIMNQTPTSGSFTRGRGTRFVRLRNENDNTFTVTGGGKFEVGPGTLTAEIANSRAEKDDPLRSEFNFRTGSTAFSATYDLTDVLFLVTPSAAAYDPALYSLNTVNYDQRKAVEILWQGRADYDMPIDGIADEARLKFGVKYLDRHKTNDRGFLQYTGSAPFTLAAAGAAINDGVTIYDGRYVFGPRVNYDAAQAYLTSHPTQVTFSTSGSLGNSLINDYDVSEQILSGYIMQTLKWGDFTVIPGLRVEHTEGTYKGKTITAASTFLQGFNVSRDNEYTDVFPGVNFRWDATENYVVRAGLTTSIGRPDYQSLAPFVSVDTGAATVSQGNPDLKPLKAINADVSVEYYIGSGVISIAGFYKWIDDPIYTAGRTVTGQTFGGIAIPTALVTQPINVPKARVGGVELNAQLQFTQLPSPFDGLGVAANYAFIGSHAEGAPGRTDDVPLFLTSKRVGSAQLYYEKYGLSARLAWSYRSHYLDTLGASKATDQYTADYHSIDVRVGYQVAPWAEVFFEGSNLNDAPWRRWVGNKRQLVENERYGETYKIGVQLTY